MDLTDVDVNWVRRQLEDYIFAAELVPSSDFAEREVGVTETRQEFDALVARTTRVRLILEQLLPDCLAWVNNHRNFQGWRIACIELLATIDSQEEIDRALPARDESPKLSAGALHPQVWGAASTFWHSDHYAEAVRVASVAVNAALQERSGRRDVSDGELVNGFLPAGEPAAGKPRLRVVQEDGMANDTVTSMQRGIHAQGQAIFAWLRNRPSHELIEIEEQEALEMLATMSAFMRAVDRCEVVRAEDDT